MKTTTIFCERLDNWSSDSVQDACRDWLKERKMDTFSNFKDENISGINYQSKCPKIMDICLWEQAMITPGRKRCITDHPKIPTCEIDTTEMVCDDSGHTLLTWGVQVLPEMCSFCGGAVGVCFFVLWNAVKLTEIPDNISVACPLHLESQFLSHRAAMMGITESKRMGIVSSRCVGVVQRKKLNVVSTQETMPTRRYTIGACQMKWKKCIERYEDLDCRANKFLFLCLPQQISALSQTHQLGLPCLDATVCCLPFPVHFQQRPLQDLQFWGGRVSPQFERPCLTPEWQKLREFQKVRGTWTSLIHELATKTKLMLL